MRVRLRLESDVAWNSVLTIRGRSLVAWLVQRFGFQSRVLGVCQASEVIGVKVPLVSRYKTGGEVIKYR
jgi:hypothetical protein